VSVSSSSLDMHASISVDSTGTASISRTCAATTITINGTSVPIGTDCNPTVSLPSIAGVSLSAPYISPSWNTGTACSTNNGTGQITCSLTACMLRVQVSLAINQVLCLGEVVLSLAVVPINNTSYYPNFTGSVTVGATVPQPTYFLRILGWTQTNPASQATADLEAVIDEDQAAFTASPFGMPDTATAMTSPFNYERLQVGHTYYLYGSSMATYNPSPLMPSGWQGALSTSSNHRVGQAVTGRTGVTSGPTAYFSNGAYYLEPIYDPMDNVIEFYGVFLPVAGHANWGKFVNSVPASSGYIVQATSTSKWIPFLQGAVAIKLDN
jgi:hypothetical protein